MIRCNGYVRYYVTHVPERNFMHVSMARQVGQIEVLHLNNVTRYTFNKETYAIRFLVVALVLEKDY